MASESVSTPALIDVTPKPFGQEPGDALMIYISIGAVLVVGGVVTAGLILNLY
jgi:hypothetical protein